MHILVLGGGGREHALAWKIAQSSLVDRLTVAPGNAGISALADCVTMDIEDGAVVADWARTNGVDLVVDLVCSRREHDHGYVRCRPDLSQNFEAIDVGEADVEYHEVCHGCLEVGERLSAGCHVADYQAFVGEVHAKHASEFGLVIDDEDATSGHRPMLEAGTPQFPESFQPRSRCTFRGRTNSSRAR